VRRSHQAAGDAPSLQFAWVILGPTAVGKTDVAIRLAERWGGEIISADSSAVYRGLDIGSAKPTPDEQRRVRFHLIDVADPSEVFTAARFRELALQAMADIQARGKRVLIVGARGCICGCCCTGSASRRRPPTPKCAPAGKPKWSASARPPCTRACAD
jgi:tRNA dimethylallyltransferase